MKYLAGIIIILMTSGGSCSTIDYNGENRLMVKGKVIDKNGNPIQGIDVETEVYGTEIDVRSDIISFVKTSSDGSFVMLFPEPEKGTRFSIELADDNGVFHYKTYTGIKKENFFDLGYNLGEIQLFEPNDLVDLNINFQNYSNVKVTDLKLVGGVAGTYYINPPNEWYYSYNVRAVKNQTITVEYKVRNYSNNQITNHTENIAVGEENLTYTLNY